MSGDYGSMISRVADEIARADLTTTQIPLAIQTAIKFYERKRFYFNTKTGTFTTVADQEYYTSSDLSDIPNLIEIDAATITLDNSTKAPMEPLDYTDIDAMQSGAAKGDPYYYAYYKQQIRLYPMPSGNVPNRTITLSYVYRLTTLANNTDTNAWMTDGEALIRTRAKRILANDVTKDDGEYTRLKPFEDEELANLMAESRKRRSDGKLHIGILPVDSRRRFNIYRGY